MKLRRKSRIRSGRVTDGAGEQRTCPPSMPPIFWTTFSKREKPSLDRTKWWWPKSHFDVATTCFGEVMSTTFGFTPTRVDDDAETSKVCVERKCWALQKENTQKKVFERSVYICTRLWMTKCRIPLKRIFLQLRTWTLEPVDACLLLRRK